MNHKSEAQRVALWLNTFFGKLAADDVMAEICGVIGARPIRSIHLGDADTMDFTPKRLNAGDQVIAAGSCG